MSIIPSPSSSRSWWSRSSVLSSKSSSDKQLPISQPSKPSASKTFNTIATAIGFRPKKPATPVQEPVSPILPLHTGDIDTPPRPTKPAVKPVPVAVAWSDPRALQPEEFLDAYPQSVFSSDLEPFATAAKYPEGLPNVSDSLRFSTFSEVSVMDPHLHQDAPHPHNRMSFASSSSLSHHRSDITSDSSPISSPLLSPVMSGHYLSRLTVDSERMREHFPPSPVSPQSPRSIWDERSRIAPSPSSATLTDAYGKGTTVTRLTRSRGNVDTDRSGNDPLLSTSSLKATGPLVIIRQPSSRSSKLQPLQPPTAPPASELPPAPGDVQPHDSSLLPAFVEPTPQSTTSSSSSMSFALSASSKLDVFEVEGHRRDMRRVKNAKKASKSRPTSPSKDTTRDVHNSNSKPSRSSREFSPTRTLRKAISIQNIPKRASSGNSNPPSLPAVEDTKSVKKQRSFHHARIPRPSLPAPLKQTGSPNASGRNAPPVPEEPKVSVQSLQQKSPLSSPVLSPTNVRKRLFSGTSLRRSLSSQAPDPDDDFPSIFSLPSMASPLSLPHSAVPTSGSSSLNKRQLSSFWDDEVPASPDVGNESQDIGPRHILSAADILKFEKTILDCEIPNGSVRSRENSITSPAIPNLPVRTAHDLAAPVKSAPPSAARPFYSLGAASSRSLVSGRQRTRGNSVQGKVGDVTNSRPQIGITSLGQAVRSLSSQSLNSLPGLPQPPRQRPRPSTSSGIRSPATEDTPLFAPGDRSSIIALVPLSPPPARRSAAHRTLDHPASTPTLRPVVARRPSFLDMRDDLDREQPPPDDSFLDMDKVSLDTVRSSMEAELGPS